jgi:hypothetical protein
MKKKYINLNEEINRMKSLFNNSRVHGNINESLLLTEQGIGRRIADALDSAGSSVAKAIKNVDPKLATNFLNSEIKNLDDLARHLNDYKSLWKSMGINWDYANDVVVSLNSWEKSGRLKNISDSDMLAIINDLPAQGDLRGMVFDLWKESKGSYIPPKTKSQTIVVTKGVDGQNVIHKVDTDSGGKIETYKVDDNGITKDNNYDQKLASDEVNAYFDGSDGSVGTTKVTTDEINSLGNPDVIKGEIIDAIEKGFENLGKKTGKDMSADQVLKEIDGGKSLMVRTADGKIKIINTVELVELTLDESGNVINQRSLKPVDTTPTKSPIKDDSGNIIEPNDSDTPVTQTSVVDNTDGKKRNFGSNIAGVVGQGFRWTFPTASQGLKIISLLGPGKKFYSKQRFSFVDTLLPAKGDFSTTTNKRLKFFVEAPVRIVAEQIALITLYEGYKTYQRGGIPKDESIIVTALADYWESDIWKYHPIGIIPSTLSYVYNDLADLRKDAYSGCRANCEKEMPADEVTNSECFKECKDRVDSLFNKIDDFKNELQEFQKEYSDLNNIGEWKQQDIEDFCEDKDGKATKIKERISKLKTSIENLESEVDKQFNSGNSSLDNNQWMVSIVSLFKKVLPGLPNLPTKDELMEKLLPETTVDGQPLNVQKLTELENKLNQACADYWAKKRNLESEESESTIITDPDEENTPMNPNDGYDKEDVENIYGSIEVVIEPIQIV